MDAVEFEVVSLGGLSASFSERPDATVGEVLLRVSCEVTQRPERLRLVWGCRVLQESQTLEELGFPQHGGRLNLLQSRERLAVSGDQHGELRLWDVDDGSCLHSVLSPTPMEVKAITADWDELTALVGYGDGRLRLWDLRGTACLRTYAGHSGCVRGLAADWGGHLAGRAPDGGPGRPRRIALSCGNDGCMKLWDIDDGDCLMSCECSRGQVLALSVDWGSGLALGGYQDGHIGLWDVASQEGGSQVRTLAGHRRQVTCLAVDWPNRRALSGSVDCRLRLWDLATGDCIRPFVVRDKPSRGDAVSAVAADWFAGRAVSGCADCVQVWDLRTGNCLSQLDGRGLGPDCASAMVIVGLGGVLESAIVTGASDWQLRVWTVGPGGEAKNIVLDGHSSPVTAVATADWAY